MNKLVLTIIATGLLMAACSVGGQNINGGNSDQPIMDGWTFEQASEFWLASVLTDERNAVLNGEGEWLTPDSLAHLTKGHVRVKLPLTTVIRCRTGASPTDSLGRVDSSSSVILRPHTRRSAATLYIASDWPTTISATTCFLSQPIPLSSYKVEARACLPDS